MSIIHIHIGRSAVAINTEYDEHAVTVMDDDGTLRVAILRRDGDQWREAGRRLR